MDVSECIRGAMSIHTRTWLTKSGQKKRAYRVGFTVAGQKRFKQFQRRSDAKKFSERLAVYKDKVLNESALNNPLTVAELGELWITACENGRNGDVPLEPGTIQTYRGYLRNYITPYLGALRIAALKRSDVRAFRDDLLNACRTRQTARKVLIALKTMIGFAIEEDYLSADPTTHISIKLGSRHRREIAIHTKTEMRCILETAESLAASDKPRERTMWTKYLPLLYVLVYGGLRLSEARGLPRSAVGADRIVIRQRADRSGRIGAPKTPQAYRTIYLPQRVIEALEALLRTHNFDLVFASRTGTPVCQNNIHKRMWKVIQKRAGVPYRNIHACRHFFASRMIEDHVGLKELSAVLGHADEAFTLRVYGHLFTDKKNEDLRKQRAEALVL